MQVTHKFTSLDTLVDYLAGFPNGASMLNEWLWQAVAWAQFRLFSRLKRTSSRSWDYVQL
jgi:hypothetical protein